MALDSKKLGRMPILAPAPVSLEIYQKLVDRCASEKLNHPIANGSPFHARILISKIFEIAAEQVSIISGCLKISDPSGAEIYGYSESITNAKRFLSSATASLSVVIQTGVLDQGRDNK